MLDAILDDFWAMLILQLGRLFEKGPKNQGFWIHVVCLSSQQIRQIMAIPIQKSPKINGF